MRGGLEGLFDGDVVVLSAPIDPAAVESLGERERELVARAVAGRRHEFATARRLARQALARLGITGCEILRDANRAPVWPEGIAGSLSHCGTRAFAAVGRSAEVGTLGIDAEDRAELPESLWSYVLRPEERAFVAGRAAAQRGRLALVIFSAKESFYKAQYPHTQTILEYSDVRVELEPSRAPAGLEGTLSCVVQRDVGPLRTGTVVPGRFRDLAPEGIVVTAAQIREARPRTRR